MNPDWNELEIAHAALKLQALTINKLDHHLQILVATLNGVRSLAQIEAGNGSKPWAGALVLIDQALDIKKAPAF